MRGYFGIGLERISKQYNVGNIFRTANAFGASFVFTISASYNREIGKGSDTSDALGQIPFYDFPTLEDVILPKDTKVVGVEIDDNAIDLPSFHHPANAVYIFGPEKGDLSKPAKQKCDFLVKIPSKFCLNVGIAGVIVMYDRLISRTRFPNRPLRPGGPVTELVVKSNKTLITGKKTMNDFLVKPPEIQI